MTRYIVVLLVVFLAMGDEAFARKKRTPIWQFTFDTYVCNGEGCPDSFVNLPHVKPALPPADPRRQSIFVDQNGVETLAYLDIGNTHYILGQEAEDRKAWKRHPQTFNDILIKHQGQLFQRWIQVDRAQYRHFPGEYRCTLGCTNFPDQVPPTVRANESNAFGNVSWAYTNTRGETAIGYLAPNRFVELRDVGNTSWVPQRLTMHSGGGGTFVRFQRPDGSVYMEWVYARPLPRKKK